MVTRLGAQIGALSPYLTRHTSRRMDELLGQEMLAEIMAYRVSSKVSKEPQMVLIFDTETTGLLPKNMPKNIWEFSDEELQEYPYITQLSAILYDVANEKICQVFNTYVRIPEHVVIPDIVVQITGITREKCDNGMPIVDALKMFHNMWSKCGSIVAHNMWFDSKMIKLEFKRNHMYCDIFKDYDTMQCTMMQGMRHIGANRFVKLSYLYEQLFGALPDVQLHNSLVDTIVCLRCYLKVYCDQTMSDKQFASLLAQI
jgi:DNA polymerase III alpha subunit (gram-positive type)